MHDLVDQFLAGHQPHESRIHHYLNSQTSHLDLTDEAALNHFVLSGGTDPNPSHSTEQQQHCQLETSHQLHRVLRVVKIEVDEKQRGQGIASQLFEHLYKSARQMGHWDCLHIESVLHSWLIQHLLKAFKEAGAVEYAMAVYIPLKPLCPALVVGQQQTPPLPLSAQTKSGDYPDSGLHTSCAASSPCPPRHGSSLSAVAADAVVSQEQRVSETKNEPTAVNDNQQQTSQSSFKQLRDRFEFKRTLATGRCSLIKVAYDRKLQQEVAVKLFNAQEVSVDTCELELSVMSRCTQHKCCHLVQLLDCPPLGKELVFAPNWHIPVAVMPLYERSLEDDIRARTASGQAFSFDEALQIFVHAVKALEELHALKFSHGSMWSSKILFPKGGGYKVVLTGFRNSQVNSTPSLTKHDVRNLGGAMLKMLSAPGSGQQSSNDAAGMQALVNVARSLARDGILPPLFLIKGSLSDIQQSILSMSSPSRVKDIDSLAAEEKVISNSVEKEEAEAKNKTKTMQDLLEHVRKVHAPPTPLSTTWNKWDHVFWISNEHGRGGVIKALKTQPNQGNTIVATSGLYGLDLLLARHQAKPDSIRYLLILDINPRVINTAWPCALDCLRDYSSRDAFVQSFAQRVVERGGEFDDHYRERLCDPFEGLFFLRDDASYLALRRLLVAQQQGSDGCSDGGSSVPVQVGLLHFDLGDAKAMQTLGTAMKRCGMKVDVFYWANVPMYLFEFVYDMSSCASDSSLPEYLSILTHAETGLVHPQTWIVDAEKVGDFRSEGGCVCSFQRFYPATQLRPDMKWGHSLSMEQVEQREIDAHVRDGNEVQAKVMKHKQRERFGTIFTQFMLMAKSNPQMIQQLQDFIARQKQEKSGQTCQDKPTPQLSTSSANVIPHSVDSGSQ